MLYCVHYIVESDPMDQSMIVLLHVSTAKYALGGSVRLGEYTDNRLFSLL